jgi:LmbE family N-acetylglucosaminyl deacetylase/predicted ATP-grasp superfamily ATP-dependent carboligase
MAGVGGRAIVVGMSGATGLAVLRALAPLGVSCHAVDADPLAPGLASRLAVAAVSPDWRTRPDDFIRFLLTLTPGAEASVFACDDAALLAIEAGAARLKEAGLRPAFNAARRPLAELLDKRVQWELARAAAVPAPWSAWGEASTVGARAAEYAYPVILKPALSHVGVVRLGAKVVECSTAVELVEALVRSEGFDVLVQELIPGGDDALYTVGVFIGASGSLAFTGRKLRQHPRRFGVARLAEAVEQTHEVRAGLIDPALRLLSEMGYEGVAQVEFKRDPRDGVFKLVEANLRPWTWSGLATACGVNLAAAAHGWALDGAAPLPAAGGQRRGRWIWLTAEARDGLRERSVARRGEERHDDVQAPTRLRDYRHLRAEAFLARDDPGPFVRHLLVGLAGGGASPADGASETTGRSGGGAHGATRTAAGRGRSRRCRAIAKAAATALSWPLNAGALALESRAAPCRAVLGLPEAPRVLVVAPHPDDDVIMCGATLAALRARGSRVRVVCCTAGGAARAAGPPGAAEAGGDLEEARRGEARRAAAVLGIDDVAVWEFSDGRLAEQEDELAARLAAELDACAPTDVFAPFPYDVHPDHRAVGRALARALNGGERGAGELVVHCACTQTPFSPAWLTTLSACARQWPAKRAALAAHGSQRPGIYAKPLQLSRLHAGSRGRPVEAFVDLDQRAFTRFVESLVGQALDVPAVPALPHPVFFAYQLRSTRKQRAQIGALLRESSRTGPEPTASGCDRETGASGPPQPFV